MTYGTGPQALVDHLQTNWQASRSGRNDIPSAVTSPESEFGVLITHDRQRVANQHGVHDLVHCYHPQAGFTITDNGYNEKNVVETVQIDIEVSDRTDPESGERLLARNRMVGDRDSTGFPSSEEPPYPGVFGEVMLLLEGVRRDFEEWDVARSDVVNMHLGNSNASISYSVDLEHIAANTA